MSPEAIFYIGFIGVWLLAMVGLAAALERFEL